MATDQIELLTREKNRDVQHVLSNLSVRQPVRREDRRQTESMLDSVAKEAEEMSPPGEGPTVRAFLTGLSWTAYALAIGAVLFLTWTAGGGIVKYLAIK